MGVRLTNRLGDDPYDTVTHQERSENHARTPQSLEAADQHIGENDQYQLKHSLVKLA